MEEYEGKMRTREEEMEVEKENLVQEVSRGKSAAINLMQVWTSLNLWFHE